MPQPMTDCRLWNITVVKLTNFITFSLQKNTAFAIGRLMFPAAPNLEGFAFFKRCICDEKEMFILSHLISIDFQLQLPLLTS